MSAKKKNSVPAWLPLAAEINNLIPREQTSGRPGEQKTPASMQDTPVDWVAAQQMGPGQSGPDRSQDGR